MGRKGRGGEEGREGGREGESEGGRDNGVYLGAVCWWSHVQNAKCMIAVQEQAQRHLTLTQNGRGFGN